MPASHEKLPTRGFMAEANENGQQMDGGADVPTGCHQCWAGSVRWLPLVQPSSLAAERVFSLLKADSSHAATTFCVGGNLEASAMIAYNHHQDIDSAVANVPLRICSKL